VGGEWRFARAEINHWVESQLSTLSEEQLAALESGGVATAVAEPFLSTLLSEASIAVPFQASTRGSVLRELVKLAEQSWNVYDPDAILQALRQREDLGSTALPTGVAIPHPRRALANALGDHVIAYGRTASGVPFGAEHGNLTDVFFLVCCRDDRTHLRVLARLSRLLLRLEFLDALRAADTPAQTWQLIDTAERELIES
jgi:PTS system nitrogen regulatory IIA component